MTAHDASPRHLAFLGSALGLPLVALGVDRFGQSGSQPDVYCWLDLSADAIAEAAIRGLWRAGAR